MESVSGTGEGVCIAGACMRWGAIKAAGTYLTSMRAQVARLLSHLPRLKSVAVLPEVQGYMSLISMSGKLFVYYLWAAILGSPACE